MNPQPNPESIPESNPQSNPPEPCDGKGFWCEGYVGCPCDCLNSPDDRKAVMREAIRAVNAEARDRLIAGAMAQAKAKCPKRTEWPNLSVTESYDNSIGVTLDLPG